MISAKIRFSALLRPLLLTWGAWRSPRSESQGKPWVDRIKWAAFKSNSWEYIIGDSPILIMVCYSHSDYDIPILIIGYDYHYCCSIGIYYRRLWLLSLSNRTTIMIIITCWLMIMGDYTTQHIGNKQNNPRRGIPFLTNQFDGIPKGFWRLLKWFKYIQYNMGWTWDVNPQNGCKGMSNDDNI